MGFGPVSLQQDERINFAVVGFGLTKKDDVRNYRKKKSYTDVTKNLPTASTSLTSFKQDLKKHCVFCSGRHLSSECFPVRKMSFTEK